jgi:hypothetical protein
MPENNPAAPIELAVGFNPFGDDNAPQVQNKIEEAPILNNEPQSAPPPQEETKVEEPSSPPQAFDSNQFLKERFGFESVEQAEEEFKRFREPKEEFKFQDDMSKTLFDAIKEGKTDDIYEILNQQKKLDKLISNELTPDLAVDIIKTNIQNKYKDLTSDEVDLLFYDQYFVPSKPEQAYDDSDEDYATKVKTWQSQVDYLDKKMMIEAKVIRPELTKLKSELKLPDIYGEAQQEAESREEVEKMQQARSIYEKTLDSDFQSFSGFTVSVKDEDVEIPISFNVAEEERLAMKNTLADFDSDSYFGERWFAEDGKPKVQQMMADKYLLENYNKILQKVANEAASQRMLAHLKKTGNININQPTPQGTPTPSANAERDRLAAWAFSS